MNDYPVSPDPQTPQAPSFDQNQPPPPPNWQPAPPSYLGQPQYPAPPTPAPGAPYGQYGPPNQYSGPPTQPGTQPYGQYGPPSQYPGQPAQPAAQPYGQYGPPSQYPGQPYGSYGPPSQYPQPGYPVAPPPGYAPANVGGPRRNTGLMIGAGILVVAVIAFFVLRGGGSSSLTGTWIGPVTINDASAGINAQTGATVELNLTESSSGQVTGSAYGCSADTGSSGTSITVSGTHSGSSVTLTIATVQYTGQISGGQLSMQASQNGASVSFNLHRGSDADYQSLCSASQTPTS